jgi:heat shock protein HslJ
VKKHLVTTIFSSLFLLSFALMAQAEAIDIAKTIWSVKKLIGEDASESRVRKINFATNQEFNLLTGCDYYRGRYQSEDSKLRIGTLNKVETDCGDGKQNDVSFLNALLNVETYELTEGSLKLNNGKGELLAMLEPSEPFDLPEKKANKKSAKHKKSGKNHVKSEVKKSASKPQKKAKTTGSKPAKTVKSATKIKAAKSKKTT